MLSEAVLKDVRACMDPHAWVRHLLRRRNFNLFFAFWRLLRYNFAGVLSIFHPHGTW